MTSKRMLSFAWKLTILLGVSFAIHGSVQHLLNIGFFEKQLILTYSFNLLITIVFFGVLMHYKDKKSTQLGFVFLFLSLLKFMLFFLIIYPNFKITGSLKNGEFFAFFVPYSMALFMEIIQIVRLLNR